MKTLILLLLTCTAQLIEETPAGKTQQLTSPDQVPEGLAKSDWQSIRAAYEAGRHAFQPTDTGWQARNPGQQWTTRFDERGFVADPRDGGWQWGLELRSYGFGENQRAISGTPAVKAEGQRLSYQWDAAVQEWWVNDKRGLEHGFTIGQRPDGISNLKPQISNPLAFTLAVRGTLTPTISADALSILFKDAAGTTALNYSGLKVWDADGKILPSRFAPSDSQPSSPNSRPSVRLLIDERAARYPITIDPIAQQAYLKPAAFGSTQVGDNFGTSVAVAGDTVVVGANGEDSSTTGVNSAPNESASSAGSAYTFIFPSANANLASLLPGAGTLFPAFSSATTSYQSWVGNAVSSITVTPTKAEANATITVNGVPVTSGSPSGAIPLSVGINTITIIVTAQDGVTTKTYVSTVTRYRVGSTKAQLISPANGTALTSTSLPLVWFPGVNVASYYLYVGTYAGGYDVYAGNQGTNLSFTVNNVPADRKIHVTLYSLIAGAYQANYYTFNPIPAAKSFLTTPYNGATLTGGQLDLAWSQGTGVSRYYIYIGSSYGGYDIAAVDAGTATSRSFTVPQDGGPIYVTLWSLINGAFQSQQYWFTTALPTSGNRPARVLSPANASLQLGTLDLTWDAGLGATAYALWVGRSPNGYDIYSGMETGTSRSVVMPGDVLQVHVTLWSLIGGAWQGNSYWFFGPAPTNGGAAYVIFPQNGSTLADEWLGLMWAQGTGATQYYIFVGSSPGASDIYAGSQGTNLAHSVSVPVDGRPVYVTLYSWINGAWKSSSSWYTTANTAVGSKPALITSHTNGATLPGAMNTFNWAGGVGVTQYALWIGSSPGAYDLWASADGLSTSRTVTLPTDGRKIHLTIWSLIGGAYQGASYLLTAASIAPVKAVITAPVSGSTFTSASQTFTWNAGVGVTSYALWIGRTPGGYDIHASAAGTAQSRLVTTLPTDGSPVYVTLHSFINGAWQGSEHVFNAWLQ